MSQIEGEHSGEGRLRQACVPYWDARGLGDVMPGNASTLTTEVKEAIGSRQFTLYYQPIVSLETGRIASVEALVRWNHPQLGLVPPDQFIPLAEENGLIVPLGDWVLQEACRQLGRWWKTLGPTRIPSVSINLSARQFHVADLGERIVAAAREVYFRLGDDF